jgi:hypothetical protein
VLITLQAVELGQRRERDRARVKQRLERDVEPVVAAQQPALLVQADPSSAGRPAAANAASSPSAIAPVPPV